MKAVVIANGEIRVDRHTLPKLVSDALIVCANGGTLNALNLGLTPQVIVGDIDSIPPSLYQALQAKGCHFTTYSSRKDETDSELALQYCVEHGINEILFLGALGGRIDHMLANVLLLADPRWRETPIRIIDGNAWIELCTARCDIAGRRGDVVSLLPWGGDTEGVKTEGLEYPLDYETLLFGPARGISNVMMGEHAAISVERGMLLVIHQRSNAEAE